MAGLRVRYLYLGEGEFLAPAEVRWDGAGRIVSLRRARGTSAVADVVLMPGLVNAHVHLQLAPLAHKPRSFQAWLSAVMAARAGVRASDYRSQARRSLQQLLAEGATAVGEIDSTGQSPSVLRRLPVAGRCYQEVTGFDVRGRQARVLVGQRHLAGSPRCPAGLSPHAPYSVSAGVLRAARARHRALAIHTAEVPEEQQFLRTGRGPFAELLESLGRMPADFVPPGVGAVRHLERIGLLRSGTQLVHCQELERGDAARIAAGGAAVTVCPGTIEYFGRKPPPVGRWVAAGIPVGLGTDSIASNQRLSMARELALAARFWPSLSPTTLLAMATRHGATALHRPGLGKISRGGAADFFSITAGSADPGRILEEFVDGDRRVAQTWLRGRRVAQRR